MSKSLSVVIQHPGGPLGIRFVGPSLNVNGSITWTLQRVSDDTPVSSLQPQLTLHIDSNNDGTITAADDIVKATSAKDVVIDNLDADSDLIPDFADGFAVGSDESYANAGSVTYVPLQVTVPASTNFSIATIKFEYDASAPDTTGLLIDEGSHKYSVIPPHGWRIWLKPGNQNRSGLDVNHGGDFIPSGVAVPASTLGLDSSHLTVTLYVEAVSPNASYGKALNIRAAISEAGESSSPDGILVRGLYNRDGWKQSVYDMSGFSFRGWHPELDPVGNYKHLRSIYAFYRTLYYTKPDKFLWAGGAAAAQQSVVSSLIQLRDLSRELSLATAFGYGPQDSLQYLKTLQTQWQNIAETIFDSIAWQHLAYARGGIDEIHRLGARNEIPGAADTVNVIQAWEMIDVGNVIQGGLQIVAYEQTVVAAPSFDVINDLPFAANVLSVLTILKAPLPGMETFASWRLREPPGRRFTNNEDRMDYMRQVLWPFWSELPRSERETLLNKTFEDALQVARPSRR